MSSEGNDDSAIPFAISQHPDVGSEFGTLNHADVIERATRAITARHTRRRRNASAFRQLLAATFQLEAAVTALEDELARLPGRIEAAVRDATAHVIAEDLGRRNREG